MPIDEFQRRVATLALRAIGPLGFALGGGNALMIHGIIDRRTYDVDLMVDREGAVAEAVAAVEDAMCAAGLTARRVERRTDLSDMFEGFDLELADWVIADHADGRATQLQIAHISRLHATVMMDVGPVLALEDVIGSKVCALAGRYESRDFADVADARDRYTVAQLIALARALDPGLGAEDFADVGDRLDALEDEVFTEELGLDPPAVAELRDRLADWPRS
ncbi:nucleotidyl transferase AbiEii/AbiGii toxin family protein [Longispora sp. NPDC051575]|uniref:nucleotidyl transferase AbiEii/AbiGii toxin family protein n=1 Tax=Longispora sp. NPDC051575 TaxID=3154943 RepID=UPI003446F683